MVRRSIALLGSAMLLTFLFAGSQAKAAVHFRYNGGRWSHQRHVGWHRYWGGPSIGFYWAPTPVYIVSGYPSARYYSGPDYWYSNPSFGLNIDIGGGPRYSSPRYYRSSYARRPEYYDTGRRYRVSDRRYGGRVGGGREGSGRRGGREGGERHRR